MLSVDYGEKRTVQCVVHFYLTTTVGFRSSLDRV